MKPTSVLEVTDLTVTFGGFTAVQSASFSVDAGQTVAIVGESGSGKTVTALAVMRLVESGTRGRITSGKMLFRRRDGQEVDLCAMRERDLRQIRGGEIAMVFQEPLTALNPVYSVGHQVAEAVRAHRGCSWKAANAAALESLERVRIPEARRRMKQYPHELSGGMRQRVMIAQALSGSPRLLIADEPTTALDVTIQAQILGLILELKTEMEAGVLFITHDMGVVAEIADRVVVMRNSAIVEEGAVEKIFHDPQHPYTRSLLAAVPRLGSLSDSDDPRPYELFTP